MEKMMEQTAERDVIRMRLGDRRILRDSTPGRASLNLIVSSALEMVVFDFGFATQTSRHKQFGLDGRRSSPCRRDASISARINHTART